MLRRAALSWWQCASRILCHHANAARRSTQLSSTLGPERLPVHRDFAQRRQTRIFDCSGRGSHQCGRDVRVRCFSQAPRVAAREFECLVSGHHFGRRSTPIPLSEPGRPSPSAQPRQRPSEWARVSKPTPARQFSTLARSSVVGKEAAIGAPSVRHNTNTTSRPALARVM